MPVHLPAGALRPAGSESACVGSELPASGSGFSRPSSHSKSRDAELELTAPPRAQQPTSSGAAIAGAGGLEVTGRALSHSSRSRERLPQHSATGRPQDVPTSAEDAGHSGLEDDDGDAFGLNEDVDVRRWEDEATQEASYAMEPTLATYAFVSLIKPQDRVPCQLINAVGYPWTLLLFTYCVQVAMVYAVQDKVRRSEEMNWHQLYDIYGDGLDGVAGIGLPRMSPEDAARVCGSFTFSHYNDSLATWGDNASGTWTFRYTRAPDGDWAASIRSSERDNTLDTTLFVLTTRTLLEFFDVPFSHIFKVVVFVWFCVVAADFSMQWQFLYYLCHARTIYSTGGGYMNIETASEGSSEKLLSRNDDGVFVIRGLTRTAKVCGVVIAVMEIVLAFWVLVVGLRFLMGTTTRLDLILNAVALGFLFDLDDIIFSAGVSALTKRFLESIELAKCSTGKTLRTSRHKRLNKHLGGFFTVVLGALVAVATQEAQYLNNQELFELAATLCLFLGPSPDDGGSEFDAVFPVPGLCESLLDLKCEYPAAPCYGDHAGERQCEYYDSKESGGKWHLQNFYPNASRESKYCVSNLADASESPVSSAAPHIRAAQIRGVPGVDLLRNACLAMWQPAPCSEPCPDGPLGSLCKWRTIAQVEKLPFREAKARAEEQRDEPLPVCVGAPRRRGARGDLQRQYAAPFWCPFAGGAAALLVADKPRRLSSPGVLELLANCSGHRLPAPPRRRLRPFR